MKFRYVWLCLVVALGQVETLQAAEKETLVSPRQPTAYTSFEAGTLLLVPWEGKHVVLLLPGKHSTNGTEAGVTKILAALDAAYLYYKESTGREPAPSPEGRGTYRGKLTIAVVDKTCGAGCGHLGRCGIEMTDSFYALLYTNVEARDLYDQVLFYELGRNFWFFDSQLGYKGRDSVAGVTTGYAIYMRFKSMEAAGSNGSPFNGRIDFEDFTEGIKSLVDVYEADRSLNWKNTIRLDKYDGHVKTPSGPLRLGAADLFASMLFRLEEDSGNEDFVKDLWHAAGKAPPASSTQDAVDNFILCASVASKQDKSPQFAEWRFPPLSLKGKKFMRLLEKNDWQAVAERRR